MIDIDPEYLRSKRTLTQSQADAQARSRARFDLTPAERLSNACRPHASYDEARH